MTRRPGDLRPFKFVGIKNGQRTTYTFYAATTARANQMARNWGWATGIKMYRGR